MQIKIDEDRLLGELNALATFTSVEPDPSGTAVTRIVFSPDDLRARAWLKELAAAEGFGVREDAIGNTFIRWQGTEPDLPAVGTGSHIDATPHAGMYDGTVGVLGGLEAMRALKRSGVRLRRSVELLLFTSEEPTRFGIGCIGSRVLSGTLDATRADALREANEPEDTARTLAEVRVAAGFHGSLASAILPESYYHAWVELHIEQGPLLEREGIPIGIVTHIAAPARASQPIRRVHITSNAPTYGRRPQRIATNTCSVCSIPRTVSPTRFPTTTSSTPSPICFSHPSQSFSPRSGIHRAIASPTVNADAIPNTTFQNRGTNWCHAVPASGSSINGHSSVDDGDEGSLALIP